MSKQILTLVVIVAICGLILFSLFHLAGPSSSPSPNSSSTFPISTTRSSTIPSGENFPIHTSSGDVVVNNFLKNSEQLQGYDGFLAKRSPGYDMIYLLEDQSIIITISERPVLAVKEQAEKDLLADLKITPAEACKLKVFIRTSVSVDPDLAGQELGLSFCPKP
jgi:hypothetical protein